MKKLIYTVLLLTVLLICTAFDNKEVTTDKGNRQFNNIDILEHTLDNYDMSLDNSQGTIYIGDSRFVGMDTVCNISSTDNNWMIAKVGKGYDFLIGEALPKVNDIIENNNNIKSWNIIICLGVNDLHNVDKYVDVYNNMKDKMHISLVSVNPIEYHDLISNSDIEEFNKKLYNIEGIDYIDTYTTLLTDGFTTTDGLHYTNKTYEDIFSLISNY